MLSHFSHVWLFVTKWTVVHKAPLFRKFSRQEYWSGLPFPSPGLPNPGIKLGFSCISGRFTVWETREDLSEWVAISYSRESSQSRDLTLVSCVSCIGWQILYHCTTGEALYICSLQPNIYIWCQNFIIIKTILTNEMNLYVNIKSIQLILNKDCLHMHIKYI